MVEVRSATARTQVKKNVGGTEIPNITAVHTVEDSNGNILSTTKVLYIETKDDSGKKVWLPAATQKIDKNGNPVVANTTTGSTWDYSKYKRGDGSLVAGDDLRNSLTKKDSDINKQVTNSVKQSSQQYRDADGNALTEDQKKQINPSDKNTADQKDAKAATEGETDTDDETNLTEEEQKAKDAADQAKIEEEIQTELTEAQERKKYPAVLKYPADLQENTQDFMLFDLVKYTPRDYGTGSGFGAIDSRKNMGIQKNRSFEGPPGGTHNGEREILSTIGLPIPAGINDQNAVDWGGAGVDSLSSELAKMFGGWISDGKVNTESVEGGKLQEEETSTLLQTKIMDSALQGADYSKRKFGMVANENMELLFNGPRLRNFTFTFRLSARSNSEAKTIKQIIRVFKQGMSPKKSKNFTFIKAPHTFFIGYYHQTSTHQWLNTFKECALSNMTMSYTPDGQYATYTDGAMTSYQMQLQFSELEPVFDSDYTELDKDQDSYIGY